MVELLHESILEIIVSVLSRVIFPIPTKLLAQPVKLQ